MTVTSKSVTMYAESEKMIRLSQRLLTLMLVVVMAAGSQAEICPMKLQSQRPDTCSSPVLQAQHAANHHNAQHARSPHDCCPPANQHATSQPKCPPVQLTACNAQMTCCSVDPQPPTTTKNAKVVQPEVAVGPAATPQPSLAKIAVATSAITISLEDSVFRHKEDLRI